MSFENLNKRTSHQESTESSPKRGRAAHAVVAFTNGLLARKTERSSESGILIAALEKATETSEALARFDPTGEIGGSIEEAIKSLSEIITRKFLPEKGSPSTEA